MNRTEGENSMASYPESDDLNLSGPSLRPGYLVEVLLLAAGWLLVLIGGIYAGVNYADAARSADAFAWPAFFGSLAIFLACFGGAVLLWGIRLVAVRLDAAHNLLGASRTAGFGGEMEAGTASGGSAAPIGEMTELIRELRDISLLNDDQRRARLEAHGREVALSLRRDVPRLIREHSWATARMRIEEARLRFPNVDAWDDMAKQVETARLQVEAQDIQSATRQVEDLSSLGAWDRAGEVVRELLDRHPDSQKARALAQRVNDAREKLALEQRSRLMAQAQEAVHKRDWPAALRLAEDIINRYPRTPDAEGLRLQLPTLQENAATRRRQDMEARIREMISKGQYAEALRVARELISTYPHSPQARALKSQMDRLEARARGRG
ncbi:MAG: tetratricopeptide repeat protein [Phycisphaerales bacterium]|nr:tetratricopeptide repeat protein [Phycisphaerales bacterium]